MPGGADLRSAIARGVGVLDRLRIPYAVIGGVASDQWGIPRMTFDLDLVVSVERIRLPSLLDAWIQAGFEFDAARVLRELGEDTLSQVRYGTFPVDLWLPSLPLHHEILRTRRPVAVFGRTVWFASPEMVVVLKLIAGRSKDWEDVKGILAVNAGRLDLDGMRRWASEVVESSGTISRFEALVKELDREARPGEGGR